MNGCIPVHGCRVVHGGSARIPHQFWEVRGRPHVTTVHRRHGALSSVHTHLLQSMKLGRGNCHLLLQDAIVDLGCLMGEVAGNVCREPSSFLTQWPCQQVNMGSGCKLVPTPATQFCHTTKSTQTHSLAHLGSFGLDVCSVLSCTPGSHEPGVGPSNVHGGYYIQDPTASSSPFLAALQCLLSQPRHRSSMATSHAPSSGPPA